VGCINSSICIPITLHKWRYDAMVHHIGRAADILCNYSLQVFAQVPNSPDPPYEWASRLIHYMKKADWTILPHSDPHVQRPRTDNLSNEAIWIPDARSTVIEIGRVLDRDRWAVHASMSLFKLLSSSCPAMTGQSHVNNSAS